MANLSEQILQTIGDLPAEDQQEVLDFVEFLRIKRQKQENLAAVASPSFFEVAQASIGAGVGQGDLSTNPDYFRGYGQ